MTNRPTREQLDDVYKGEAHLRYAPWSESAVLARRDCRELVKGACRHTSRRGRSLDVGCGDGAFSFHLHRHGFAPTLADPDPRAAKASERMDGSILYPCLFEEITDFGPYDVIVMSHVLEHSLDPMQWLRRAEQMLSPGGALAVAVPNFVGVYRLLGARDPFLNPPIHLNYFTPKSLDLAMRAAGLNTASMGSMSDFGLSRGAERLGLGRRAFAHSWNAAAHLLDRTTRGIVLTAIATKSEVIMTPEVTALTELAGSR